MSTKIKNIPLYSLYALLTIFLVGAVLFVSFFWGLKLYKHFSPKVTEIIAVSEGIKSSSIQPTAIIDNETLLSLLGLLVGFAGLLSYIFQRIIRKELKEETKEVARAERMASRAEVGAAQSYILANLYDLNNEKYKDFLDMACELDKKAFQDTKELDRKDYQEEYGEVLFRVKNNYLNSLVEQQRKRKEDGLEIDQAVRDEAIRIKNELWELIISGKAEDWLKEIYHAKETCAWTDYCFAESNEQKQRACKIVQGLKGKSPEAWYHCIVRKYADCGWDLTRKSIK